MSEAWKDPINHTEPSFGLSRCTPHREERVSQGSKVWICCMCWGEFGEARVSERVERENGQMSVEWGKWAKAILRRV